MSTQAQEMLRELRQNLVVEIEDNIGSELDTLNEFLWFASKWQQEFLKVSPLPSDHMFSPIRSRDAALMALFAECLLVATELTLLIRSGLVRPATVWLRKLYETHVDIRFIELDYTGQSALRWHHWGVAQRAKLRPNDSVAQKERAQSEQMFKDDKTFGRRGYWAKSPSGKFYTDLASRARFVDDQYIDLFANGDKANFANSLREELLAKTNALVHPNIVGNEEPMGSRLIMFLTAFYTFHSLLAFKNGVDEYLPMPEHKTRGQHLFIYPDGNGHLVVLAQQVLDTFDQLTNEILASYGDDDTP